MGGAVLWHIEVSHYNEKVRWALDYKGVAHRRRAPLPGLLHPVVALAKTRQPLFPILELDGEKLTDSTRIIAALERRYPDPPLYPADPDGRRRALELEDWFDEEVGPNVRRFLFYQLSLDPERSAGGLRAIGGAPLPGRAAAGALRTVARRYGGTPATMERAREATRRGYERIVAEVGPSGYMVGDSFGVADLTAASLLLHLAEPPEFQYEIPEVTAPVAEFRDTLPPVALDWVRRMWREHRGSSAEVAA